MAPEDDSPEYTRASETRSWLEEHAPELRASIDPELRVLHDVRASERAGGGDVDCAVAHQDESWPLRLSDEWRVCQRLWYDIGSTYWVLARGRDFLAIDLLHDRRGLGRYAFPSPLALRGATDAEPVDGILAPAAVRAAYLTVKRLRKKIADPGEWQRIQALALAGPAAYRTALEAILGGRGGRALAEAVLQDGLPPDRLRSNALRRLGRRRYRTPLRALLLVSAETARLAGRIARPTGFVVVIVGPDGTGKSTLARALPAVVSKLFRRTSNMHFRPGVLPRPGAIAGTPVRDSARPQSLPPHSRPLSLALLGYHWLDFVIGSWWRLRPIRIRSGLVVLERGWWDILVDPRRYRLDVSERLIRALGALVPRPDLLLVLSADPEVVVRRKSELSRDEVARQLASWELLAPRGVAKVQLDASLGELELLEQARAAIVDTLEERCAARLAKGWLALPGGVTSRFFIPRGPGRAAWEALRIYNPHTRRARAAWKAARPLAKLGAFRLSPRGSAPPAAVRRMLAQYVPRGGTYAVARSTHPGRYTALVLDEGGGPTAFVKLARNERGARALAAERDALELVSKLLPEPLVAPSVVESGRGVLVLEPIRWQLRHDQTGLPTDVARALGAFFRAGAVDGPSGLQGYAHGDLAPWNLLRVEGGWLLVDWEAYRDDAPPFYDVFHHVVQTHAGLGRPSLTEIRRALTGKGMLADVIEAYAEGAGLRPADASSYFGVYLRAGQHDARLMSLVGPSGVEVRRQLLARWEKP